MNDVRDRLAPMFAEVLLLDEVGPDDSFFDLDGDSLAAVELIRAIAGQFGVTVPIGDFFAAPTVNGVAALLDTADPEKSIGDIPRPDPVPLSPSQEGIWVTGMLTGWAGQYNLPVVVGAAEGVHLPTLEDAVRDVMRRHEILRTRFPEHDGVPYQDILDVDAAFPGIRRTTRTVAEVSGEDFDVTSEAPLRVVLADDGLVLLVHHLAADGPALVTLMRDLDLAYGARRRGTPPEWPGPATQYADFAVWQQRSLERRGDAATSYWRERLRGAPLEILLPSARPRPSLPGGGAATVPLRLAPTLREQTVALAGAAGVTPFLVLQTAFAAALAEAGAGTDIVIGTPFSGRTHPDLEEAIGLFVNLVALRTDLSGQPSFRDLLAQVRAADPFRHADVPFGKVVEAVAPRRRSTVPPVVQVSLSLDGGGVTRLALPEIGERADLSPLRSAKFDLGLVLDSDQAGGFTGWIEYATELYDAAAVEDLRDRFAARLENSLTDPDAPIPAGS
ncbi:hypothetical protein HCA58_07190 [Micromonospora sp. HNM0581]|uniref:condensation domain-containing protein n=1 Tax=Micromonospora sp. HNM0581 TaxID=2716341 RepID=UPI00146AFA85|nr:condensation domain-containing protein [Micromonospora sp. HNM0581]NLU78169.1 hypothetical protein [Micromonospora sp. HNM0581]